MVKLISVGRRNSKVLDPGAGKGAFLEVLKESNYSNVSAYEIDEELYKIVKSQYPEFNVLFSNFLSTSREEKFEVIIGNPPYVHWNDIDKDTLYILNNQEFWNPYINGEWDLLYAFIIWSVEKLLEDGEIIFIVPYYWFNSTYAYTLREYLSKHGVFEIVIHMGEYKLFPDCAPNNIIFKYRKTKDSKVLTTQTRVIEYTQRTGEIDEILKHFEDFIIKKVNEDYIYEDDEFKVFFQKGFSNNIFWSLMHYKEKELIESIERISLKHIPLINLEKLRGTQLIDSQVKDNLVPVNHLLDSKDIKQLNLDSKRFLKINGRFYAKKHTTPYLKLKQVLNVGVGMVTGFDEAFLVDEDLLTILNPDEEKVITFFVKGKSCRRFWVDGAIPYIFADGVQNENVLEQRYPNIHHHLIKYKEKLDSRYKSKNIKYYQWATVRNLDLFTENLKKEKLFVPCLDRHKKSRFSYTTEPYFGSGDVLVITKKVYPKIKESLQYICAWLNSDRLNTWYKLKGTKRGHRTSYTQTRVEEIPIRLINWEDPEEVQLHEEILTVFSQILEHPDDLKEGDVKLEKLITSLFIK